MRNVPLVLSQVAVQCKLDPCHCTALLFSQQCNLPEGYCLCCLSLDSAICSVSLCCLSLDSVSCSVSVLLATEQ